MLLKVCCIRDEAEMEMAAHAGATHLGLVGPMPSGPGCLPDEEIARLARVAPDGATPVLLTSESTAEGVLEHLARTGVSAVQLVLPLAHEARWAIRRARPDVELIQVVHVEGAEAIHVAEAAALEADMLLLDSGRPSAATPELGGTGRVHDWRVSAEIVSRVGVPVLLAGGLNPENAAEAIRGVRPAGLDVCSGLRDEARVLQPERLHAFARATLAGALA